MIALRPYQTEAISAVRDGVRRGIRRPLIGLPTGTGKTVVFSTIVSGAVQKGNRALVLAHRDELLSQATNKLCEVAPDLAMVTGRVQATLDEHDHQVVVASVQTLARERRLARLVRPFSIIIVDEAHHAAAATYQRILEALGSFSPDGPLTIGVTATPQRADSLDLGATWEEIVYHRDMLSMMREGYLCDLRGVQIRLGSLDLDDVKISKGDYEAGAVGEALEAADAPEHGVRAWHKYCKGRKTICFTPTIALAHEVAAEFNKTGVPAAALSGNTPRDERREMLARFSRGELRVIANAQVLTEGYDEPTVECIMIARPTKSQPLYVQMVGRGTRCAPGKKDCVVLDIVGATERLDLTTLPKLFGLGDDDPTEASLTLTEDLDPDADATDTGSILDASQRHDERERRAGRITAHQVELFARTDLSWVRAADGLWVLNGGREEIHLRAAGARWDVVVYKRGEDAAMTVQQGLDQGYAMGAAEDYARRSSDFNARLVAKDARHRQRPATIRQLEALRRFGIRPAAGLSGGEASDQLAAAIARKTRRHG